ncbi:Zn-ribbon domain-containing OB-fold protein [Nocardioides sp. NPDC051685]|uniref:Zn-ribbon domain-containing OB-fold protein n=1 Tax=Nocardioides sp. NPDC051685 TaxID=3364334 RepID=UPI00378C7413
MSVPGRAPARRDEMTAEWFDALNAGRLLLRTCPRGHRSRPDVLVCDHCGALDLGWAEAGGRGTVVARAVDHSTRPATCLVIVELDEGPWLTTRLEGASVERGENVVVRYVQGDEGEAYPVVTGLGPDAS